MQSEECRIMVGIRRNADSFLCIDKCENIDVGNAFMHSEKRTYGMDKSIPYDVALKVFYCRGGFPCPPVSFWIVFGRVRRHRPYDVGLRDV